MRKQLLLIVLAGLMTLAACHKDKENQGEALFTASIEHQGGRTSLDPNNGNINWTAGDQIVIANANDESAIFSLRSGEGTTEGGFGTSDDFNTVGPFIAAYPETATIANDVLTFNLPATQAMGETGTFANGSNPMVACSDDKNLQFRNLCGGLGIRLKGVGAHVSAVRITSKDTNEKLWGTFEVSNCAANEPTLTEAANNQGTNVITLTCDVTLTTAAKTFFVMLPPGTLANGFIMEVLDGNEVLASKETDTDIALVERNNVKVFNEILIDVEFDGNVEIPAGMNGSDIIVSNYTEDAIPDENGDFSIGYSKMLMATNTANGEIIYISTFSVDSDNRNGEVQNYELNAKETALTLSLQMFPFGLSQSKDATFASIKDVLYSLSCVQSLETAIETVVRQHGYLKMDELSSQLLAVRDFFMEELFPESKSNKEGKIPVVGTIELSQDGNVKMDSPWLTNSYSHGIRIEIKGSTYHPSTNTWTVDMTAHSENGIYVGVNRGHFQENNMAHISGSDKPVYFIPPMNAGKFIGTFVSWSGLKAYFSELNQFLSGDLGFDETTWDMATLENIHIELGTYYDALAMVSPGDDTRTAIVNAFYTVLGGVNCWVSADGIQEFFLDLFLDDNFTLIFINNWNHGVEGFTIVANELLERFEDFMFEESVNLLARPEIMQKALGIVSSLVNYGAFVVGTAASLNFFESFAFHVSFPIPIVQTMNVENNTTTTAELKGKIVGETGYTVVEGGFCYSLASQSVEPSIGDANSTIVAVSSSMGEFSYVAENLMPNELYFYRAYAKTDLGEVFYGNSVSFFTHVFPTIHDVELVSVSGNNAEVRSVLDGETSMTVIERGFKYNTIPLQWGIDVMVPSGSGMGTFSATLEGLSPSTNYRVEAYAKVIREGITIPFIITSEEVLQFTTLPSGGGSFSGHDYVDLGLPSGLLWATCNVGAESPEDYGDYFAWGETTTKDTYDWSTYQYCMGDWNTLTKYCSYSDYGYNGFEDNLTTLLPEDDAATANWGNGWRMPTQEEWQELFDNTTSMWTTMNDVNGRLFTATNGNTLFLPAAGNIENTFQDESIYGRYYSRSLYVDFPRLAWGFWVGSDDYGISMGDRCIGVSVRAVREN